MELPGLLSSTSQPTFSAMIKVISVASINRSTIPTSVSHLPSINLYAY